MKLFSWVQRKLSGKKPIDSCKELQSWHQDDETFLAIGTLGNNICFKEDDEADSHTFLTAVETDISIRKKKSLSFLLRDSLRNTRMEKMLRTMLNKKIHPQCSNANKYLENNHKILMSWAAPGDIKVE